MRKMLHATIVVALFMLVTTSTVARREGDQLCIVGCARRYSTRTWYEGRHETGRRIDEPAVYSYVSHQRPCGFVEEYKDHSGSQDNSRNTKVSRAVIASQQRRPS
jgi:hypothetical protein